MVRTSCGRRLSIVCGLIAALTTIKAGPRAAAIEDVPTAQATLAPRVASQNADLDAVIASMVKRRIIADLSQPRSTSAPPAASHPRGEVPPVPLRTAGRPAAGQPATSGWRPAGSAPAGPPAIVAEPIAADASAKPTSEPAEAAAGPPIDADTTATPPEDAAANADAEGPLLRLEPEPAATVDETNEDEAAKDDADKDDLLAPIDELSETPAPESDAPGDPIEPEFTGEALESTLGPVAKPLSAAPKVGGMAVAPLGEPDRLAKPLTPAAEPTDPRQYQQAEPPAPAPSPALRPLSRNQQMLRDKVRRVLRYYYDRPLNTADRSPWEVMHSMLGYEVHSRVLQGGPKGQPITAVGWLCFNQPCRDRTLLYLNEDGDLRVKVGPALQGHHGQLLALLAQSRVRSDYPMKVDGRDFTVADLIEVEKATCYPRTELTFKLIGLQRYLDIDARWVNDQGMAWDFPTLIREEIRQPVKTAACGGTHRLGGLALAVKKRQANRLPVDGAYAEADRLVENYRNYAFRFQNSDGSFSTSWFNGPGAESDIDRRLKTTGHTLEWMIYATDEQQLTNHRIVRAVNYLTNIMYANRNRDWEAGPLGHAIHALVLYDRLVFAKHDQAVAEPVAAQPRRSKR